MANYSLVIDSHFKPFSYAEMLAPVQAATQAHQELESAYSELETKANIWDKLASETSDPKAHSIYQKYADDLNEQAGELAKNGLSLSSRQALLNMKNRYTKEITPIEDAFNRRKEDIKAQKEMMQKDPYHMYDRMASTISLDEYMDNPNLDVLSANQSKLLLKEQVSKAAHNLKTALTSVSGLRKLGLPFQYQQLVTRGYTPEQIMKEMMHDPQAAPILGKIVEDVMASSGIRNWSSMNGDWANNQMYREAEQFAMQGLYDAIGGTEIKYHKDDYGMQLDLMNKKHALENPPIENHASFNPLALRNPEEVTKANQNLDKYIKAGYITERPNGTLIMTNKGMDALRATNVPGGRDMQYEPRRKRYLNALEKRYGKGKVPQSELDKFDENFKEGQARDPGFYKFMKEMNGGQSFITSPASGKQTVKAGWGPNRISNMLTKYRVDNAQGSYDTFRTTEYEYGYSPEEGKKMLSMIASKFGTGEDGDNVATPVVFDRNTKGYWKKSGDDISVKDLLEKGYYISSVRPSKYGITMMIQASGKDAAAPIRVKLPATHKFLTDATVAAASNLTDLGIIRHKGKRPVIQTDAAGNKTYARDLNGNLQFTNTPLTEDDMIVLEKEMRRNSDDMFVNQSSIWSNVHQEPEKNSFNPSAYSPY